MIHFHLLFTLQALEKEYQLRVHYQVVTANAQASSAKLLAQNAELRDRLSKIQVCWGGAMGI